MFTCVMAAMGMVGGFGLGMYWNQHKLDKYRDLNHKLMFMLARQHHD